MKTWRDKSDAIVPRRSPRATGLSPLATVLIACVLPVGAESPPDTPTALAAADTREVPSTVRDDTAEPEEVVVTGSRLEPGSVVPYEDMQHVHDSRAKGACLYKRGRYDEAFPYLQAVGGRSRTEGRRCPDDPRGASGGGRGPHRDAR